jgi:hypothetical protein
MERLNFYVTSMLVLWNIQPHTHFSIEYTAPYTLQQNGVFERQFATDLRRSQSMMEGADLTEGLTNLLKNESIMTPSPWLVLVVLT